MRLAKIKMSAIQFRPLRGNPARCMAGLLLGLCLAQPAGAGVIPLADFHPLVDSVLDLTGAGAVQFQRVVIDAGITLRILTPADGRYAQLWATDDIVLNGVMDAGAGALNLVARNGIVLGFGARLTAGSLALQTGSLNLGDIAYTAGGALSLLSSTPVWDGVSTGVILTSQAVDSVPNITLTDTQYHYIVLRSIPEPATGSLLLMGLALLAWSVARFGRQPR